MCHLTFRKSWPRSKNIINSFSRSQITDHLNLNSNSTTLTLDCPNIQKPKSAAMELGLRISRDAVFRIEQNYFSSHSSMNYHYTENLTNPKSRFLQPCKISSKQPHCQTLRETFESQTGQLSFFYTPTT